MVNDLVQNQINLYILLCDNIIIKSDNMRIEQKIVDFLVKMPEKEFTINGLAKELHESYSFLNRKINQLAKEGVILKRSAGKAILCSLNLKSDKTKALLHMLEVERRDTFFGKNREISLLLSDFLKKVKAFSKKGTKFILIFGSWAKGHAGKESDVDVLILAERKTDLSSIVKELNAQYGKEIVPVQLTPKEFIAQMQSEIIKEIIKNHIILSGFENFIDAVWSKS